MDEQKLRQLIKEEIKRINKQPIIKDVHLHIHGDGLDSFDILERITTLQSIILEEQILEKLNQD